MTGEPDFIRAKNKISDATSWRGDVNVSLGDETVTFKHRLLNEKETMRVKNTINVSALSDDEKRVEGQTEAQQRLLELQQKEDELTEEEKQELQEITKEVAGQMDDIEEALGTEAYDMLMELGRAAIEPSEEDIDYVYDSNPNEMKQHLGVSEIPNPLTKGVVGEHLKHQLQEMITDQPYPIKLNVGMQAFSETLSVLGNGFQE